MPKAVTSGFLLSGRGAQPPAPPDTPAIGIRRLSFTSIAVDITLVGENDPTAMLKLSEFNAWRLFGLLGLALGIKLSKEQRKIKL